MLADTSDRHVQFGSLRPDVHLPSESLDRLIDFIAAELPCWRDSPDRPSQTAENALTSQLCGYLNTAARHSNGWDILQFRVEEPDEQCRGRKIDLIASPCGPTLWIGSRRCTHFDTLLPIECKRLPTPKDARRDEREYVIDRKSTTGGIQRFKSGVHGAEHRLAAMIGYLQADSPPVWHDRLNSWISELDATREQGWSSADMIHSQGLEEVAGLALLRSQHMRAKNLESIDIRHLWINMNVTSSSA